MAYPDTPVGYKEVTVVFDVRGYEGIEVPEDWVWDGTLESILEFTDLEYKGQELLDLNVREGAT